tara:strand:- start:4041 stop:4250 length:210 start_codon:yes stop_codon:yes gene_type:complete
MESCIDSPVVPMVLSKGLKVNFDIRVNPLCELAKECPAIGVGESADVLTVIDIGTGKERGQFGFSMLTN